jgi:hypothetical protein
MRLHRLAVVAGASSLGQAHFGASRRVAKSTSERKPGRFHLSILYTHSSHSDLLTLAYCLDRRTRFAPDSFRNGGDSTRCLWIGHTTDSGVMYEVCMRLCMQALCTGGAVRGLPQRCSCWRQAGATAASACGKAKRPAARRTPWSRRNSATRCSAVLCRAGPRSSASGSRSRPLPIKCSCCNGRCST